MLIHGLVKADSALHALGARVWIDPNYVAMTSGKVSTAYDRSGRGNNLTQGTAANRPTIGSTTGKGKYISFVTANVQYLLHAGIVRTGSALTNVYLINFPAGIAADWAIYEITDDATASDVGLRDIRRSADKLMMGFHREAVAGVNAYKTDVDTDDVTLMMITIVHDKTQAAASELTFYFDGSGTPIAKTSIASNDCTGDFADTSSTYLGSLAAGVSPCTAYLYEFLEIPRALASADVVKLYAAVKAKHAL